MQHPCSTFRLPLVRYGAPLLVLLVSGACHGVEVAPQAAPLAPTVTAPVALSGSHAGAEASKSPFKVPAVSPRLLASSRAGSASAVVTETGSLQQTTATNVQTGTNAIGGGSFANALGLTTVIQNSGANVLIQNATTINVQFK